MTAGRLRWKRVVDLAAGGLLLVLTLPVTLLGALLVVLTSGVPVFYRQERIGYRGLPFRITKLRTMRPAAGAPVTAAGDPRVTPVGRVLRRFKLDELPQLWQVVRGEMSLVGPRPEVPQYVARYAREYRSLRELRPVLTDFASLIFRDEEELLARHAAEEGFYERRLLPRKLALARLYRRQHSPLLDLKLVLATACAVIGWNTAVRRLLGQRLIVWARTDLEHSGTPLAIGANLSGRRGG